MLEMVKEMTIQIEFKNKNDCNDKRKKSNRLVMKNFNGKGLDGLYSSPSVLIKADNIEIVVDARWLKEASEKFIEFNKL